MAPKVVKPKKNSVNEFLRKVAPKAAASKDWVLPKIVEGRTIYRLILSEETVRGQRRIECTYADGTRIHGMHFNENHPLLVLSANDQDEILWVAKFPFEIRLKNGDPFFRTFPARASMGADKLYRVASGPPKETRIRETHEFGAFRLLARSHKHDEACEHLDPHFVVEP